MSKRYTEKKYMAMRAHCLKAMKTRYNVTFNKKMRRAMVAIMESKERLGVEYVLRQSNRCTVYDVTFEDVTYRMVYDKHRNEFATALSLDMDPIDFRGNGNEE